MSSEVGRSPRYARLSLPSTLNPRNSFLILPPSSLMSHPSSLIPHPSAIETLRWREGRLELLDQRLLPARVEFVSCATAQEVADAIRGMVIRGAPAIGCAAAYGIALEATRLKDAPPAAYASGMDQAFQALAASRPTAVNLFWALERMGRPSRLPGGRGPRTSLRASSTRRNGSCPLILRRTARWARTARR